MLGRTAPPGKAGDAGEPASITRLRWLVAMLEAEQGIAPQGPDATGRAGLIRRVRRDGLVDACVFTPLCHLGTERERQSRRILDALLAQLGVRTLQPHPHSESPQPNPVEPHAHLAFHSNWHLAISIGEGAGFAP